MTRHLPHQSTSLKGNTWELCTLFLQQIKLKAKSNALEAQLETILKARSDWLLKHNPSHESFHGWYSNNNKIEAMTIVNDSLTLQTLRRFACFMSEIDHVVLERPHAHELTRRNLNVCAHRCAHLRKHKCVRVQTGTSLCKTR
eukprot:2078053-Amphidinium_carterae.2